MYRFFLIVSGVMGAISALYAANVVSKVQCLVEDPGTLKEAMGFEVGQSVGVVTLDDGTSDIDHNGDYCVTSFPAVLNFAENNFSLDKVNAGPLDSTVDLEMQGSLGETSAGILRISVNEADEHFDGAAHLESCHRLY